jgi:hypothetical protein
MPAPSKDRKPWPMRWVVLAIVLFIPLYTYLTLHFRRKDPAFVPYQDMRDRADVIRLLNAGYQRVTVDASRPAESIGPGDPASPAPGGLPPELAKTLIESPLLPQSIDSVSADRTAASASTTRSGSPTRSPTTRGSSPGPTSTSARATWSSSPTSRGSAASSSREPARETR